MRRETNQIKQILAKQFSQSKFNFKYCKPKNYIDSSDCIKITCDDKKDVEKVIEFLKSKTKGIAIYKKGEVGSVWNRHISSQIMWNCKWIDFGMCEFIEVN